MKNLVALIGTIITIVVLNLYLNIKEVTATKPEQMILILTINILWLLYLKEDK